MTKEKIISTSFMAVITMGAAVGLYYNKQMYDNNTLNIVYIIASTFIFINGTQLVVRMATNDNIVLFPDEKPDHNSTTPLSTPPLIQRQPRAEAIKIKKPVDEKQIECRLEEIRQYTKEELGRFLSDDDLQKILINLADFSNHKQSSEVITSHLSYCNGLTRTDIFHYVWNIWHHIDNIDRHYACRFFINSMPGLLGGISEKTMYAKMTKDYGTFSIPLYTNIIDRTQKD